MTASLLLWGILLLPPTGVAAIFLCASAGAVLRMIRLVAVAAAFAAFAGIISVMKMGPIASAWDWIYLDALSAYHLGVMFLVFLLSSLYLPIYYAEEIAENHFTVKDARRFAALWFGAMLAMTIVLFSNNIGILWVGIEATTLVTAFLICVHRSPASIEATWKYLIICSVGVAFAFMGTLLTGAAADGIGLPSDRSLLWTHLQQQAGQLNPKLMKTAFLFLLVGYGTKAGLAPMHNWLPDAHSQAPAPVSALFSGFMLNAALYCILRYLPLVEGAVNHSGWSLFWVLFFGLFSILLAAPFIIVQRDLKRLLAYCSVEHIGIIAVGVGLGGPGIAAALLHTLNHSIGKSLSFFAAGRLGQLYGTQDMPAMAGALRAAPVWGRGLFGGLLVLMGMAPFAVFLSEFLILRAAAIQGSYGTLALFLIGVTLVFIGMLRHAMNIAWGEPIAEARPEKAGIGDKLLIFGCMGILLLLGLWIPGFLQQILDAAARIVEGRP